MSERITSFRQFWPVYLRAHADPRCRALHYLASLIGLSALLALVLTGDWRWLLAGLVGAYASAWAGHLFMEKNLPLTFRYPLWSLAADYRMFFRWLTGGLRTDLARAGV
jgi:Predicted membrane protein